jgi:hypothetical protein
MVQALHPPGDGPPCNIEAERQTLGACILRPEMLRDLEVSTAHFFGEKHRVVWRELQYLAAEGEPIDTLHLRARLQEVGKLAFVGDDYLLELTDTIPAKPPIDILERCLKQRVLRTASQRLQAAASDGDDAAAEAAIREAAAALETRQKRGPTWELRSTAEIFAPLPPVSWRVRGLQICPGRPCILGGYGASAKTLSAQQLALAVASGTPAWGYFDTELGNVVHLDYEQGFHATAQRYQRLAFGHHIEPRALSDRLRLGVFPRVYLDQPGAYDVYAKLVDGVHLVVLDALRGAAPSSDENDSSIRACIDNLTRVAEATGCSFVLLHHARKQQKDVGADDKEGLRGSAGIFDGAGAVYLLRAQKDPNEPRAVKQIKPAAEAAGRQVEDFRLDVLDIPAPGNPTAGVRVLHKPVEVSDRVAEAMARDQGRLAALLELIRRNPGSSKNAICRSFGGRRTDAFDMLVELHRKRLIRTENNGSADLLYAEPNSQQRSHGPVPD